MSVPAIVELAGLDKSLTHDEQLDSLRLKLEPYIYHHLIEQYGPQLNAFWQTYNPPKQAPHAYVIVERRPHPNFAFILKMIAWASPQMSVYIFCSEENLEFIKILLGNKIANYNLILAFSGKTSRQQGKIDYNNLLTSQEFYEIIKADYMLTIQMDTIIRRKIPTEIFCGSYWGNPWAWKSQHPGGGGSTIRHVKTMIDICKKFRPDPTQDLKDNEDSWIADRIVETNSPYPDLEFRKNHIMESIPSQNPVVLHQFWTFAEQYHTMKKEEFIVYWTRLLTLDI
jgi:hypothetical protein